MAAYRLSIRQSAVRELDRVSPRRHRIRIVTRIQELATEPRPNGSEKLVGGTRLYRVRQGNYRIVYAIDDHARSVDIVKIGHRRDVYRDA